MTAAELGALASIAEALPIGSIRVLIAEPTPANLAEAGALVASAAASVDPEAEVVARALEAAAAMLRHPSQDPIAEGQMTAPDEMHGHWLR